MKPWSHIGEISVGVPQFRRVHGREKTMWAVMVIEKNRWNTREQASDRAEAQRRADLIGGMVVPWEQRLLLLDNGLLARHIRIL